VPQLTDQAVVAVALARGRASAASRPASVVDLLIGLAEEPDGVAGRTLGERVSAVVALSARALPPRLAPMDVAVSWALAEAAPRPGGTGDLLDAALQVGGADLADVLDAVGFGADRISSSQMTVSSARGDRQHAQAERDLFLLAEADGAASETVGLRPPTDPDRTLSQEAALAVARTRAMAAGAVGLLLAAAGGSRHDDPDHLLPAPEDLLAAVATLARRGAPERAGEGWDLGVDTVLRAARTWRAPEPATTHDLVRAAEVAGGSGPAALLEEVWRRT